MNIRDCIEEVLAGWDEYLDLDKVSKEEHVYDVVVRQFPEVLESVLTHDVNLRWRGSTGQTQITAAPWVATFDTRITKVATQGYYLVYLFSVDLKRLYLVLGLGVTQFTDAFPKKKECYPIMHQATERMRGIFSPHIPEHLSNRLIQGPIDLSATQKNRLHRDYEQGAIYSLSYDLDALPSEEELREDYRAFVSFYQKTAGDPTTPDNISLIEAVVGIPSTKTFVEGTSFVPRPPKKGKKKKEGSEMGSSGAGKRYSKNAKVIGDAGEQRVLDYERTRLTGLGRPDLAKDIIHEEGEKNRPGWDITSYEVDEDKRLIEVKASETKTINSVELTDKELAAATNPKFRDKYYVYLVTNALSPTDYDIEILKSPADYIENDILSIRPIRYELSLHKNEKEE